jgi:hypothetical protein
MNFSETHPLWMWLYFGAFGSAGVILVTLIAWHWMKFHALAKGYLRSAAKWNMFGYVFLFAAATFA